MNPASLRPPPNLQPRPKAVPTFSSTSIAARSSTSTPPQESRQSSKSRHSSPVRSSAPTDTSDRAAAILIRRVLCPRAHSATDFRPIHELLPPLTSSNDVDFQLYAIIAIVIKDVVHSWYGSITPDQGFVEEVVRIIAHCTTQLESRLRTVDLESLVFDEIPDLIASHIHGWCVCIMNISFGDLMLHNSISSQSSLAPCASIHTTSSLIPQLSASSCTFPCARSLSPCVGDGARKS